MEMQREQMEFDVVIVGAGPAGLAAAIRLKQLSQANQLPLSVCILEKGSEVGAHILSGNVFEVRALDELLPNWQDLHAPLNTQVSTERFYYLSKNHALRLPTPPPMDNQNNYVISLGNLCRWLAKQAEELGVEIYPGFAASSIEYNEQEQVIGVIAGEVGIGKDGKPGAQYQPGVSLAAKQTLFAEGCRGSLSEQLIKKFNLRKDCSPQTYGLGLKELWEIKPELHKPGLVIHSVGWPLDKRTYGGSFLYHMDNCQVAVGFVVGLDYQNPYLDPFQEMQRLKTHKSIRHLFSGGQRIAYGARALNEGGWQSIPKLSFPGGLLLGDSAGFLNVAKLKGTHTAMKSGMLAAQTIFENFTVLKTSDAPIELTSYQDRLNRSWISDELYRVRNIRPGFHWGLKLGLIYAALDTYLMHGHAPWTLKYQPDHQQLRPANKYRKIAYPAADNKLTFDKLSSVYLSNTNHKENQPCHLQLKDPKLAIDVNHARFASPETHYCPANVYEIIINSEKQLPYLQINAQNCIHCKACDIKDPLQNILWTTPEGGDGPNYGNM